MKEKNKNGFTSIELIITLVVLAIIAGIIILALKPKMQLGEERNAQRKTDVNTILNAVYQYQLDTGSLPPSITKTDTEICATEAVCSDLIDLSVITSNESYLVSVPQEPSKLNINGAGYLISKSANDRVTVSAQFEEKGEIITATR